MLNKVILGACALALTVTIGASRVNADEVSVTELWNRYASQYHFANYPVGGGASFADSHRSGNLQADLDGITGRMAVILDPGPGLIDDTLSLNGDDALNATLEALDREY